VTSPADFTSDVTSPRNDADPRSTPLRDLIPIPKLSRQCRSRPSRQVAHAKIITESPYKRKLESALQEKIAKENKCKEEKHQLNKRKPTTPKAGLDKRGHWQTVHNILSAFRSKPKPPRSR